MTGADGIFHPDLKTTPYWWDHAAPVSDTMVELPAQVDAVIVGGGYTGLNAALTLREGGASVLVLDAQPFGWGASSRNAGHVSSGVNLGKGSSSAVQSPMERRLGANTVAALRTEAGLSLEHLEARLARYDIDCDYRRSGRFVGAVTKRHFDQLAAKADAFRQSGARMVPRTEQREEIGSDSFHGGMVVEAAGQLHPARYLHGLLGAARSAGVLLSSDTAVSAISRENGGFRVMAGGGEVSCKEVLVATNGYTGALTPWLQRCIIPAASYIIVTEPLAPEVMADLIPRRRTIADTRRLLSYFRATPDGTRLLFGGRATLNVREPRQVAPDLYARIMRYFPQLRGTRITHAWNGRIAFTFDLLPHLGERDGVHHCMGCNGSGVAMQSFLGHRVGQKMLGQNCGAFDGPDFPAPMLYGGRPWFLPLMTAWYQSRDSLDMALDRFV